MAEASHDDVVKAICPEDKPHKCPPHSTCYGLFEYCSPASRRPEPCVDEAFLRNADTREKVCRDVAQGLNVTKLIRHKLCNLEGDCRVEFKTQFLPSTQDSDHTWTYILAGICALLVVILVIAAVLAVKYIRKKAKRDRLAKEQSARMLIDDNGDEIVDINANNRINESRQDNNNTRQQSTDHEEGDPDNTELMAHIRENLTATGNIQNSPDSGIIPDSTAIPIHADSSSGSVSNRNSNHSPGSSSSASFGSLPQEENQRRPSPGDLHYDGHPADRENRQQRGVHMPSSEPSGRAQLVTNHTSYHHSNDGDLE